MQTINRRLKITGLALLLALPHWAAAGSVGGYIDNMAPMRERVQQMEAFWKQKKAEVLPAVMREQGVDCWIVRNDEAARYYNNEGPVYTSLLPANYEGMTRASQHVPSGSQATPRIMVFFAGGDDIEYHEPRDLGELGELLDELNPDRIAISYDNSVALLDALTAFRGSLVDSWTLGVRWLETMVPAQIEAYRQVQGIANELIAEGFSNTAITPGVTTTDDLNWWFRQRMLDLDIEYENHPSIRLQRRPEYIEKYADEMHEFEHGAVGNGQNVVIRPGDVITIDSDIFMLGLVLLQDNIAVFSVRVMFVRKAPCAGNGRSPWQARQRGGRASRERPSGGSVSAPGRRCASWQGRRPLPARRALPGTLTDPLNTTILSGRSTSDGFAPASLYPGRGRSRDS